MGEDASKYKFPETLNLQKRLFGLPPEEAIVFLLCGVIGFCCDILVVMLVVGVILWLFIRHLKKGQGSEWLMNLLYWYLPTMLFRVQFRRIPTSSHRHWMQ